MISLYLHAWQQLFRESRFGLLDYQLLSFQEVNRLLAIASNDDGVSLADPYGCTLQNDW